MRNIHENDENVALEKVGQNNAGLSNYMAGDKYSRLEKRDKTPYV